MTASEPLRRVRPAEVDVDAAGIDRFVTAASVDGIDLHSLVLVRRGGVFAEAYWRPYTADGQQLLYSLSKTFTASAIALAIGEGRFSLADAVVDLLPGRAVQGLGEGVDAIDVRHLLSMASGHDHDTIALLTGDDPVAALLAAPLQAAPGTTFAYNQGCTYLLSAIIATHTGHQLSDYLRPRLFDPLGIGEVTWRQTGGLDQGFSGLHARTRDIAALGQLYLDGGRWAGEQLLPTDWVAQASTAQIDNSTWGLEPDWQQGYGFQLWRCRHDSFRGDGAFGQFMVVVPWAELVIATTAQTWRMQELADLFWQHLLPAVDATPAAAAAPAVDATPAADVAWTRDFEVDPPPGRAIGSLPGPVSLRLEPAEFVAVGDLRFTTTDEGALLELHSPAGPPAIIRVTPQWRPQLWPDLGGSERQPEPGPAEVMVAGGWQDEDTFTVDVIVIRTPHRFRLTVLSAVGLAEIRWETVPL